MEKFKDNTAMLLILERKKNLGCHKIYKAEKKLFGGLFFKNSMKQTKSLMWVGESIMLFLCIGLYYANHL